MPKNKYLVTYKTPQFNKLLIVIWAKEKAEAKKMLKRHLGSTLYSIVSIKDEHVEEDICDE